MRLVLTRTFRGLGKNHSSEHDEAFCFKTKPRGQESGEHAHKGTILCLRRNSNTQGKYDTGCTGKHFQGSCWLFLSSSSLKLWFKLDLCEIWVWGVSVRWVYFPSVRKHSGWGQTNDWEWAGITGIACRKGRDKKKRERDMVLGVCIRYWMQGGYRDGAVSKH